MRPGQAGQAIKTCLAPVCLAPVRLATACLAPACLALTRLAGGALTLAGLSAPLHAEGFIEAARYTEPTRRYDHGVLGDDVEWGALVLTLPGRQVTLRLPETRVFEDTEPRLADLDGDGAPEVIAVESDVARGARLSIYGPAGLVAATPFIGLPHRWLAPLGAADLDGDGRVEIAYVDRPHLAGLLRIWRLEDGVLQELAQAPGHSNHRIGWDHSAGGIRSCTRTPEILTADPGWRRLQATRLEGGRLVSRDLGPWSAAAMTRAMACRD